MSKRTLNPLTAFYGDLRHNGKRHKHHKLNSARAAYKEQWPDKDFPLYAGCAYDAYEDLAAAGWAYSTRYGWRKKHD